MFKTAQIFNQKGVATIALLVVFLVVAVAGGSYYQLVYKPKLIKETTNKIQTDYKALTRSVNGLVKQSEDNVSLSSDNETIEKFINNAKKLTEDADKDVMTLEESLSKKQSEVRSYTDKVDEYYNTAKDYVGFIKGGIGLLSKIIEASKDLSDLGTTIQNSNTNLELAKKRIKDGIEKMDKSIKEVEGEQSGDEYKGVKDATLELLTKTKVLLTEVDEAIDNQNAAAINASTIAYTEDVQEILVKYDKASEDLEEKQKEFEDKLKEAADEADEEYNNLDQKYK